MTKSKTNFKKKYPLTWQGRRYEKVYIIQNHDLHAGFGALLIYALNGIRKAKAIKAIPVIDFNAKNSPYFYDSSKGEDVWNYFFESITPYALHDVLSWEKRSEIDSDKILYTDPHDAHMGHQYDSDRLATFWAWETPTDKAAWMRNKRALGRSYIKKYLSPQAEIKNKVERFVSTYFKEDFIIGVHIRGTDFHYATPTPIEAYLQKIDNLLTEKHIGNYKIFVATDQEQYLQIFKEHYGGKILSWNSIRSDNYVSPYRFDNVSGYQKGEDVLIDILLLSKCNYVFKGASAVGEIALWFCDHNNITDFAIESEFYRKELGELESTYSQLNLGNRGAFHVKLQKLRDRVVRRVTASRIGSILFFRYSWVRKILKQ